MATSELKRAAALRDRLYLATLAAAGCRADRVTIPIEDARELVDLLSDSLRTAERFGTALREYDGTAGPIQPANVRRLRHGN